MNLRKHFYLCTCSITFVNKEDEMVVTSKQNTMLRLKAKHVTVADLGKAQQTAQLQLIQKMDGLYNQDQHVIVDCVIDSISYLGEMTEEEFAPKVE